MNVARENRKNRELRRKLEEIINQVCNDSKVEPKNIYHVFVGTRNTGQQVSLPDVEWVIDKIVSRFSEENQCKVYMSHRNICIQY